MRRLTEETQRRYAYSLKVWLDFLSAVDVPWGRATRGRPATTTGLRHHAELVAEFKTKARTGGPITPNVQALRQQLTNGRQRIQELEANLAQLQAKIATLCAVIAELTHETRVNNVVAMPMRSHRDA